MKAEVQTTLKTINSTIQMSLKQVKTSTTNVSEHLFYADTLISTELSQNDRYA